MDLSLYTAGIELILNFQTLSLITIGTLLGILTGCLPGLTATMGVSILVPITYNLSPSAGILMLVGIYLGGVYGGSISATLLNIPGTPSAIMTALDAYPLAQKGKAGYALSISTISSAVGGLLSVFVLVLIAPAIADIALEFTSYEMFAIALFGLSIIAAIAPGSMVKALMAGSIGLIISTVGADPITAEPRFIFGNMYLYGGIQFIAAMVGLYGVTEIILNCENSFKRTTSQDAEVMKLKHKTYLPSWLDIKRIYPNICRSSFIGVIIGAIPGAGGTIASIVAYGAQKKITNSPEDMGNGSIEGIAASESSNNACTGGAMITLLSLGIPGDAVTAILIGAFMIHGLQPGPLLFQNNIDLVSAIFLGMVVVNVLLLFIGLYGARYFAKLLSVPGEILNATIIAFCFVGSFAIQNSFFDIKIMLAFSALGYLMVKAGMPRAPIVLALILGPLMESNLRRAISLHQNDIGAFLYGFLEHPIAAAVLALTVLTFSLPLLPKSNALRKES
ncbi:hypothetical protein BTW10_02625 [Chromohalobacter japonicus]|uniref:DUF112 domain-containing protein n=1 Tax=Chromohalobacter japonicus TaxID=223900 RepID=A0A1Q8TFF1_9GAMM|nr:tripartite tricarboxylate transporter permease [Chromohalobacter japonicus]OLO12386.1 hypothetical protein BTW10_02625 [Chromohalobacter japonicus]